MSFRNFINLDRSELDKNIFRVITVDRLFELFHSKKNSLSHPSQWDDPFENLILNGVVMSDDHEGLGYGMRESVFGQSWSFKFDSDAMWRIYAPNNDGVLLRTTIRKLHQSLMDKVEEVKEWRCFIGRVKYVSQRNITAAFEAIDLLNSNGSGIAESLLIKRTAFRHEGEVRLIYSGEYNTDSALDYFVYDIDPFSLFDALYFDPRMNQKLYAVYKKELESMGFSGKLTRSKLYDPPKKFILKL